MRRLIASFAVLIFAAGCASAQTLYEGARVIPGDGSPAIEDAAFLVEGGASPASASAAMSRRLAARGGWTSPARP